MRLLLLILFILLNPVIGFTGYYAGAVTGGSSEDTFSIQEGSYQKLLGKYLQTSEGQIQGNVTDVIGSFMKLDTRADYISIGRIYSFQLFDSISEAPIIIKVKPFKWSDFWS